LPSAPAALVSRSQQVHRIPLTHVRDDRDTSLEERDAADIHLIFASEKTKYFVKGD
jgi:hypothetical protein